MTPEEQKLKKLEDIFGIITESITREEFVEGFKLLMKTVEDLQASNLEEFKQIEMVLKSFKEKLVSDNASDLEEVRDQVKIALGSQIQAVKDVLKEVSDKMASIKDGENGKQGPPGESITGPQGPAGSPDTADEVRDKLETLAGDERLNSSAIKGFEELEKAVAEKTGNTTRIGWGAHPLTIKGLGITIDKNTRFINFKGTAITSVTRTPDGVVNVTIDQGSTTGTLVSEEIPVDTGDHTNFTIAHTPIANTFQLYRGGARQQSIGVSPDYSLTGTALTLVIPLDTGNGEQILCQYSY